MPNGLLASLEVSPLPPGFDPGGFDCGEPDLTDYLCDGKAEEDQGTGFSRTYIVQVEGRLVGYCTVLADGLRLKAKERPDGVEYSVAPALKLGRMGVHTEFRGRDIGQWILDYVVGLARDLSDQIGIRYVTLDALSKPGLVSWYERYGFVRNEGEPERQIALLKFFKRWKSGDELRHVSMRFDILLEQEVVQT